MRSRDLHVRYGNVEALHGINLTVNEGEIVTILGANGAGKSTTLLAISGLVRPSGGEIAFGGKRACTGCRPTSIVRQGIAQAPEGRRIFGTLTVRGEPDPRRLRPHRRRPDREDAGVGLRALPDPEGAAASSWPAPSPAASSRCSPSAGP